MEDRETARMRKYGESKTTLIMMATVPHDTSGLGLKKCQADGFLLTRVCLLQMFSRVFTYHKTHTLWYSPQHTKHVRTYKCMVRRTQLSYVVSIRVFQL